MTKSKSKTFGLMFKLGLVVFLIITFFPATALAEDTGDVSDSSASSSSGSSSASTSSDAGGSGGSSSSTASSAGSAAGSSGSGSSGDSSASSSSGSAVSGADASGSGSSSASGQSSDAGALPGSSSDPGLLDEATAFEPGSSDSGSSDSETETAAASQNAGEDTATPAADAGASASYGATPSQDTADVAETSPSETPSETSSECNDQNSEAESPEAAETGSSGDDEAASANGGDAAEYPGDADDVGAGAGDAGGVEADTPDADGDIDADDTGDENQEAKVEGEKGNSYIAEVTPDAVAVPGSGGSNEISVDYGGLVGGEEGTFTITFTEVGNDEIGSAQVEIPDGFSGIVFNDVWSSANINTSGDQQWQGKLEGVFIYLQALDESSYLGSGEWVEATFSATTTVNTGVYEFKTEAWTTHDHGNFGSGADGDNNMAAGYSDPVVVVGTSVSTADELDDVRNNLGGHYVQTADIDLGVNPYNDGEGWEPIGRTGSGNQFTGSFHGNDCTISNLTIDRPEEDFIGLFGYAVSGGLIKNVTLENVAVKGKRFVGGLVGYNIGEITGSYATGDVTGTSSSVGGLVGQNANTGTITGSYATGNVTGTSSSVGGLVGQNSGGTITDSHATGAVKGNWYVGGLVGLNSGEITGSYATGNVTGTSGNVGGLVGQNANTGTITDSYATGAVTGTGSLVGGLVGGNNGTITGSYATGDVTGTGNRVGGLAGASWGTVTNSYATGDVTGTGDSQVGGLVGWNSSDGTITGSYATGAVEGDSYVGGLVGLNSGEITYSYATGAVQGNSSVGGLVGTNWGTVSNSYWDKDTSGQSSSAGGTGKTTAEMQQLITFKSAEWSISDQGGEDTVWRIYEGSTYPLLRNFFTDTATITVNPYSKTYDGVTLLVDGSYELETGKDSSYVHDESAAFHAADQNVGEHEIIMSGVYSKQLEYDLIFVTDNVVTITARPLQITADSDSKIYDGTPLTNAGYSITGATSLATGQTLADVTVTGSQTDVGSSDNDPSAAVITDGDNTDVTANYNIDYIEGTLTVTVRELTLSNFVADDKTYDGDTDVTGDGFDDNRVTGDELTFSYTVAFEDKKVGDDKDVEFTGITISGGADQGNYTLVTTEGTATADITARDLILSDFVADGKVYDGNTDVLSGDGFADDRVGSDDLEFSYNVAFEDKNVGTDKDVNFTGITISGGADRDNYNLVTNSGTAQADITPRSLTITANDITKIVGRHYTFAGTEFSTAGLVEGDEVSSAFITSDGAPEDAEIGDYVISIGDAEGTGLHNYEITYVEGIMNVVFPFVGGDFYFPLIDPITIPAFPGKGALTAIIGGADAIITPAFVSGGSRFDLAQALLAYQALLQRYEEEIGQLTVRQSALIETELAIALAAILALEALLLEQDGEPYDLAALIAAYETAEAVLGRNSALLSAGQVAAAQTILQAIATAIAGLTA